MEGISSFSTEKICVQQRVLFYYGCVSMGATVAIVYLQIFAGNYFADPPFGVPTFGIDMYYITMDAYWAPVYPLKLWWCYVPFYVCSIMPIICYLQEFEYQKCCVHVSLMLTALGCGSLTFALIKYCTAITQGLIVYENMVTASNQSALLVSVDWVKGCRCLFLTAMSSLVVMLLYTVMNFCILVCPFVFTLPINYIAVDRSHNNSVGTSGGGLLQVNI